MAGKRGNGSSSQSERDLDKRGPAGTANGHQPLSDGPQTDHRRTTARRPPLSITDTGRVSSRTPTGSRCVRSALRRSQIGRSGARSVSSFSREPDGPDAVPPCGRLPWLRRGAAFTRFSSCLRDRWRARDAGSRECEDLAVEGSDVDDAVRHRRRRQIDGEASRERWADVRTRCRAERTHDSIERCYVDDAVCH